MLSTAIREIETLKAEVLRLHNKIDATRMKTAQDEECPKETNSEPMKRHEENYTMEHSRTPIVEETLTKPSQLLQPTPEPTEGIVETEIREPELLMEIDEVTDKEQVENMRNCN